MAPDYSKVYLFFAQRSTKTKFAFFLQRNLSSYLIELENNSELTHSVINCFLQLSNFMHRITFINAITDISI